MARSFGAASVCEKCNASMGRRRLNITGLSLSSNSTLSACRPLHSTSSCRRGSFPTFCWQKDSKLERSSRLESLDHGVDDLLLCLKEVEDLKVTQGSRAEIVDKSMGGACKKPVFVCARSKSKGLLEKGPRCLRRTWSRSGASCFAKDTVCGGEATEQQRYMESQ